VRFLDPAGPVRAPLVRAGLAGTALADLAAGVDRGFPGGLRDQRERGFLPLAQRPADGVDQLVAAARGELVQLLDQVVAGTGPVAGDHQLPPDLRRQRRDRLVKDLQVVRGGVAAGRAGPHHPGQRLARIVTSGQQ